MDNKEQNKKINKIKMNLYSTQNENEPPLLHSLKKKLYTAFRSI